MLIERGKKVVLKNYLKAYVDYGGIMYNPQYDSIPRVCTVSQVDVRNYFTIKEIDGVTLSFEMLDLFETEKIQKEGIDLIRKEHRRSKVSWNTEKDMIKLNILEGRIKELEKDKAQMKVVKIEGIKEDFDYVLDFKTSNYIREMILSKLEEEKEIILKDILKQWEDVELREE